MTRHECITHTFQKNETYTLSISRVSEWEAGEGSHLLLTPAGSASVEEMKCENTEDRTCWKVNSKSVCLFFCPSASAWRFRMWETSFNSGSLSSAHTAECFTALHVLVSVVRLILDHQRVLWQLSPPRLCWTSCTDSGHPAFLLKAAITRISVSVWVCQRKEKLRFKKLRVTGWCRCVYTKNLKVKWNCHAVYNITYTYIWNVRARKTFSVGNNELWGL